MRSYSRPGCDTLACPLGAFLAFLGACDRFARRLGGCAMNGRFVAVIRGRRFGNQVRVFADAKWIGAGSMLEAVVPTGAVPLGMIEQRFQRNEVVSVHPQPRHDDGSLR